MLGFRQEVEQTKANVFINVFYFCHIFNIFLFFPERFYIYRLV